MLVRDIWNWMKRRDTLGVEYRPLYLVKGADNKAVRHSASPHDT